jgi:Uncharacterized conserved protein
MKPRGLLMIEHRLIEKMLKAIDNKLVIIQEKKEVDPVLIDTAVDFIKTYADRTHHGKEEGILFRDLEKKKMSPQDDKMMHELIDEHTYARKIVGEIVDARNRYANKDASAFLSIIDTLKILITFYHKHIKKEDMDFFPNTEKYFTDTELDTMLDEFWKFDREMIHEKYKKTVEGLESL